MSKAWKHRIENFGAEVKARGIKRAEIEAQLDRIRSSMTIKTSGSFETMSSKTHSTTCSENSSLASGSSAGSNSRDVIRQGLREKEIIINKILQRNSGMVDEFEMRRAQMQHMMVEMEQKEALTQKLQIELEHIKKELHFANQKTKEDTYTQSIADLGQIDHIEKELEKRDEQIHFYDRKLRAKAQEVHDLRGELAGTLQRVVELEVELETHNIRLSSLQDQRCRMDQQALEGMFEGELGPDESTTNDRQYVQTLLVDLDGMERRYIQARVQGAAHVRAIEEQMKVSEGQIIFLEKKLASQGLSVRGGDRRNQIVQTGAVNNDVGSASSLSSDRASLRDETWKQELHMLEVSNVEYSQKVEQLKDALNACKASADSQISKDRKELQRLSLENDALITKIAALEVDGSHGVGNCGDVERCRRYEHLEKRLDGNVIEILRLQNHLRTKDRINAALRTQTVRERLSVRLEATPEMAEANSESIELYLKALQWIDGDQVSGVPTDESDFSHFYELLTELNQTKKKVHERDEELRIVRAQSAARIAGLRARIDEMQFMKQVANVNLYFT